MLRLNLNKRKRETLTSQTSSDGDGKLHIAGSESADQSHGTQPPATTLATPIEREKETEQLMRYWRAAEKGHGRVVLLAGEAGSGKTTLADAFMRMVQAEGKTVKIARATCSPQSGRDESLWPFAEVISQLAASSKGKTAASDFLDTVLELAPSWVEVIPVAGTLIGASIKTAQVVRERTRSSDLPNPEKLLQEYAGALSKVADKSPVLFFIDDLHWSDAGSIKLLAHLARSITSLRVMAVAAYRPSDIAVEGHPLLGLIKELVRYDTDCTIKIPALSSDGIAKLVNSHYPANKFPPTFAQILHTTSGGSPFFIEESLRLMECNNQIMRDEQDGKWMLVRDINAEDLPSSVEAVVNKRIERMPKPLQDALALAAIQGVTFETAVLAHAIGQSELSVLTLLEPAEKVHQIINYAGDVDLDADITSRFRFTSSIIQRELSDSLRGKQRMLAHRKTAEGMEALWGTSAGDLAPQMAVHNELGKVYEKAAYYHLLSGRTSRMSGEIAEAIEHFETAEQQYMKTGSVPPDMQFEIDENLSFLYEQDASFNKAEARAKHALLTGFDQLGWQRYAMLQMRVAQLADNAGRYNDALDILLNLHTLLDACTDDSRDCAQAYELHAELAQALTQVGREDEGAAVAEEALSKLALQPRTDETRRLHMHLMIALTDAHTSLGHYKQVSNLLVDVCNQATQMRAQDTLLEALMDLAELHVILGEYDQARETISEINTLVQRLGDESALAASSLTMARLLFDQGRYTEALPHLDKTDALIASTGYNAIYPQALSLRALAYINLERSDEALPLLEKAYPVGQASGSRETVAWIDVTQAMYEMSRNELAKALELAQNALHVFQEEHSRYEQALTLRVIGMAYRQQGLLTQSRKCYADAASLYAAIGNKHLLKITEEESER